MELTALKERLNIRAQAFISDPDLVTDQHLTIAATEAIEIASTQAIAPVLMDIAFYRYLLLVEKGGVTEEHINAYHAALKQLTQPVTAIGQENALITSNVKTRINPYL